MQTKESMSSRERVLRSLNHEEPDRVPIDFGGFQTGIHKRAYEELLRYLGTKEQIKMLDAVQQLAAPSEEILRRFRVDIRYVCAHGQDSFKGTIVQNVRNGKKWYDLKDEFGVIWSMPDEEQLYMDISHHPLANATIKDIEDHPFPDGSDKTRFTGVREEALRVREETGCAASTGIGGVIYETCWYMRGPERWYMDMVENPKFCEALLDKMLGFWLDYYTAFFREVGDTFDIVMTGDDIAGQHGPLFSPDFYRQVVKPRQKKLVGHIKSLTKAKICYHTCGSCIEYIPDLIDNGVDILIPVQISADRMDPKELKSRFGKDIVLWGGGINAQHILPYATSEEVKEQVRRNIEIFKPGGGYVFSNVHNIQVGVPAENIEAFFDAAYEFGFYK